jgi:2-oxoglutarate ferredoxin oxidoreductase subunit gamma
MTMSHFAALEEIRIRFGGIGGQGAVLLGDVLGHGGALAGLNSACSTIYGSRARGGASQSDVILSPAAIDFPHVIHPHVLVAMADEPYAINVGSLTNPAVVLFDAYHFKDMELKKKENHFAFQATRTVMDALGAAQPANFFMLGALVGMTGIIAHAPIFEAMRQRVRPRFFESNRKAFELGARQGRRFAAED